MPCSPSNRFQWYKTGSCRSILVLTGENRFKPGKTGESRFHPDLVSPNWSKLLTTGQNRFSPVKPVPTESYRSKAPQSNSYYRMKSRPLCIPLLPVVYFTSNLCRIHGIPHWHIDCVRRLLAWIQSKHSLSINVSNVHSDAFVQQKFKGHRKLVYIYREV